MVIVALVILSVAPGPKAFADTRVSLVNIHAQGRTEGGFRVEEMIHFSRLVRAADFSWRLPVNLIGSPAVWSNDHQLPVVLSRPKNGDVVLTASGDNLGDVYRIVYHFQPPREFIANEIVFRLPFVRPNGHSIDRLAFLINFSPTPENSILGSRIFTDRSIAEGAIHKASDRSVQGAISGIQPETNVIVAVNAQTAPSRWGFINRLRASSSPLVFMSIMLGVYILPGVALLSFIVIALYSWLTRINPRSAITRSDPPSDLSPAEVSLLLHRQLNLTAFVATIFDLAQRGYIDIYEKDSKYRLSLRKALDSKLRFWEAEFLTVLFPSKKINQASDDIDDYYRSKLFSRKIAMVYESLYETVTTNGYFIDNPALTLMKFKLWGLIVYALALFSLLTLITSKQPLLVLLPAIGFLITCHVIFRLARFVPQRSPEGNAKLNEWLGFRKYLMSRQTVELNENTFFAYYPFALIFGVQNQWIRRSKGHVKVRPSWLYQPGDTLSFTARFSGTARKIAQTLAALHGPLVQ